MINFKDELNNIFMKQNIASKYFLDKLNILDEADRNSPQYQDPLYFPFYYYLSKFISPKSICQIGADLGLSLCCFLQGASSANKILGFQFDDDKFYSSRFFTSNIRKINKKIIIDFYLGNIYDKEFQDAFNFRWDLIFINQKLRGEMTREIFDFIWMNLNDDGYLVVDHLNDNESIKNHFINFSKIQNREFVEFNTRYGIGIIKK